jgi:hypothetical protein
MARFRQTHNYDGSPSYLKDAQLNLLPIVNELRLSHEFAGLVLEGYPRGLFHENESEWTKDSRIKAKVG